MTETQRIADQLRRAWAGDAWFGPGLKTILEGVTPERAAARPVAGAHTIWELVLHVTVWNDIPRRRLAGGVPNPPPEEDWPAPSGNWEAALAGLERSVRELHAAILAMPEDRLPEQVRGQEYSVYFMLHGAVQHAIYHAGQIAILKRA